MITTLLAQRPADRSVAPAFPAAGFPRPGFHAVASSAVISFESISTAWLGDVDGAMCTGNYAAKRNNPGCLLEVVT